MENQLIDGFGLKSKPPQLFDNARTNITIFYWMLEECWFTQLSLWLKVYQSKISLGLAGETDVNRQTTDRLLGELTNTIVNDCIIWKLDD